MILQDLLFVGQDGFQLGDQLHQFGQLVFDLLALQAGQRAQLHGQDGPGLNLGTA